MGFFDSGVGGLTVFSEFRKTLPNENCIYFGDTKNMPYGEKSKEQLLEYSKNAFEFFETKQVKAVVMACNTTSATVYDALKDNYSFKLYPIIQSVSKIIAELPVQTIGIFATPATVNSHAYANKIKSFAPRKKVIEIACPKWVKIVEEKRENTSQAFEEIKQKLDEIMPFKPDKIVLGCTHYPFLLEQLSKLENRDLFINPAKDFVEYIKNDLQTSNMLSNNSNKGVEEFFASASPEKFKEAASMFYELKSLPQIVFREPSK